jgi:hypothetical protein
MTFASFYGACMKELILVIFFAVLTQQCYEKFTAWIDQRNPAVVSGTARAATEQRAARNDGAESFSCDGRIYCSQMRSCAEATFFLRNCPGTAMDANQTGIPCKLQWCN